MEASQSAESQSNDMDMLKKKEDEHFRLQRQFRMIQTDRANRTMGVHPQFRRQDLLLRALKQEYISMSKDLKIARSGRHKKNDKRMKVELRNSLLLRTKIEQECEAELFFDLDHRHLDRLTQPPAEPRLHRHKSLRAELFFDLDHRHLDRLTQPPAEPRLHRHKSLRGGNTMMEQLEGLLQNDNRYVQELKSRVDASLGEIIERQQQSERRLISTENQLEVANMRFNAVQCENKRIREEIEHMLKDRVNFNKGWTKMITALTKGKKFLTDLFESSTVAYDQRDEWCTKLKSMTEKGRMDQSLQVQEMRDLQKAFDHEMKMFNFLAKKGVMRVNKIQERREEEEKEKELEEVQKELTYHLDILREINDYTQEPSIDGIIDGFQRIEQDNFSIYKLMCEYCAENEVLTRDLARIRQEVADRRDWNESQESQRQEKLQKYREELDKEIEKNEELRRRRAEQDQLIEGTMDKIYEIFKMLNLSLEPFQNLLGDKQPSLQQLGLTLCLINDKIKEHIATVYYMERMVLKKDKTSTSRLKKYTIHAEPKDNFKAVPINLMVPADPCPACTEARWLSRVTETQERPLSLEGVRAVLRSLLAEPAYERSDRVHPLADCRLPASRLVLAKRYL